MNDWDDNKPWFKQAAEAEFCRRLANPANSGLRTECTANPAKARSTFADCGQFYLEENLPAGSTVKAISRDTLFMVYEAGPEDIARRGKLVTLVLRDKHPEKEPVDPAQVWLCTYYPYDMQAEK